MNARVPFSAYRCEVLPQWLDADGHMNIAYYVLAFDRATDAFLDNLQLGRGYATETGCEVTVLEMNVSYKRGPQVGSVLHIDTQLLEYNDKKLRIIHQMFHETNGALVASNELLLLHVRQGNRQSCCFPPEVVDRLEEVSQYHFSLELPEDAGRVIRL